MGAVPDMSQQLLECVGGTGRLATVSAGFSAGSSRRVSGGAGGYDGTTEQVARAGIWLSHATGESDRYAFYCAQLAIVLCLSSNVLVLICVNFC
jgi:hypothetical protein